MGTSAGDLWSCPHLGCTSFTQNYIQILIDSIIFFPRFVTMPIGVTGQFYPGARVPLVPWHRFSISYVFLISSFVPLSDAGLSFLHQPSQLAFNLSRCHWLFDFLKICNPTVLLGLMEIPAHTIQSLSGIVTGGSNVAYTFCQTSMLHRLSNQYFEIFVDNQCRIRKLQLAAAPELGLDHY